MSRPGTRPVRLKGGPARAGSGEEIYEIPAIPPQPVVRVLYHPPMPERIRLRIGNMGKAVLVTGQAYQDPKDALNEFVSNAADEYAEAGQRGERIRVGSLTAHLTPWRRSQL